MNARYTCDELAVCQNRLQCCPNCKKPEANPTRDQLDRENRIVLWACAFATLVLLILSNAGLLPN